MARKQMSDAEISRRAVVGAGAVISAVCRVVAKAFGIVFLIFFLAFIDGVAMRVNGTHNATIVLVVLLVTVWGIAKLIRMFRR